MRTLMAAKQTPKDELLASVALAIRDGGVIRVDAKDGLGTLCLSHEVSAAVADAIDQAIGIKMMRNGDGSISIQKI